LLLCKKSNIFFLADFGWCYEKDIGQYYFSNSLDRKIVATLENFPALEIEIAMRFNFLNGDFLLEGYWGLNLHSCAC
jgi:hypothetical protein